MEKQANITLQYNSEEIQEIITAVPSWILRRGITLIFLMVVLILVLSALIKYPDIIKVDLKVNSLNAPKGVSAKRTGKITSLLVKEGTFVIQKEPLAFMESTANHRDVLKLAATLNIFDSLLAANKPIKNLLPVEMQLGELQSGFQRFYQQYLQHLSAQHGGYYLNRKKYLMQDLIEINNLKGQIIDQQKNQEQEYANMEEEYNVYKKLFKNGVVSNSEFKQQQNKYLASKYPLQQSKIALLNNNTAYAAKQKEILDINHTIEDEQAKFVQALHILITETNSWIMDYIVSAPIAGRISYAGILQENQTVNSNRELFIVNPDNTDFFGEVQIPQYNMGKIRINQPTLVKMKSFPFEQYGLIRGKINYISEVAYNDSLFIAKINFERYENKDPKHKILLKNGMRADAEIITEESSLLQRFFRNLYKVLYN